MHPKRAKFILRHAVRLTFVVRNGKLERTPKLEFRSYSAFLKFPTVPKAPKGRKHVDHVAPEKEKDSQQEKQKEQNLSDDALPAAGTAKHCKKRKLLESDATSTESADRSRPATQLATDQEANAHKRLKRGSKSAPTPREPVPWSFANDKATPMKPMGLPNTGNFCYRRSFFQCLFHAPEFVQWLGIEVSTHNHPAKNHKCLACGLYALAETVWTHQNPQQAVTRLDTILRGMAKKNGLNEWLASRAQHDSHEVFTWLCGALLDEANAAHASRAHNSVALKSIFDLTTSGNWTCPKCSLVHTSYAVSELGLQLGIEQAPQTAQNLSDHLALYFHQEISGMTCERASCKAKNTCARNITISAFPRVLVIQLQRFAKKYDARTRNFTSSKSARRVRYPLDLDMSEYGVKKPRNHASVTGKYRLSSVVAHSGALDSGHYVAYADSPAGVMRLDDATVSKSSLAEMLEPKGRFTPYLLFYREVV